MFPTTPRANHRGRAVGVAAVLAAVVLAVALLPVPPVAAQIYFHDGQTDANPADFKEFHIVGKSMLYALRATNIGPVVHLHWGKLDPEVIASGQASQLHTLGLLTADNYAQSFDLLIPYVIPGRDNATEPVPVDAPFSRNSIQAEFSEFGSGDFRLPSFDATYESNGVRVSQTKYAGHEIFQGKPAVDSAQPAFYVEDPSEATTLRLDLVDPVTNLGIELWYTVYHGTDIITRRTVVKNNCGTSLQLHSVLSALVDLPVSSKPHYTFSHLAGAWARERHLVSEPILGPGTHSIHSRRGASSHQHNPFGIISDGPYSEDEGEHFAFSLVYTGNFLFDVEMTQVGFVRIALGLEPLLFTWRLADGDRFVSPEAVLAYSSQGVGEISRQLHSLTRTRLVRPSIWRDAPRPILVNSWEAFYMDVSEDKIVERLGIPAAEVGMDLIVLDDGWFGERNNDRCCLGDWTPNPVKFPNGLKGLTDRLSALGLKSGIWMEPEMISEDSDLYRAHPDWALSAPGRTPSVGRWQLVLDLSRTDVQDFVINSVNTVLASANFTYLKWDFNRHLGEMTSLLQYSPAQQGELYHRWVLGLYHILDVIMTANPDILFEGCSGGGGRFDLALLHYFPQYWTSDNTDAVARLKIQYGTSIAYPLSTLTAHVAEASSSRHTPFVTRGRVAMGGMFGYELDLANLSEEETAQVREQIQLYREIEDIVREGSFYRLLSPFDLRDSGPVITAWMMVTPDKSRAVVFAFLSTFYERAWNAPRLKLQGLDPLSTYTIANDYLPGPGDIQRRIGSVLMSAGITVRFDGDASSWFVMLNKVAPHKDQPYNKDLLSHPLLRNFN